MNKPIKKNQKQGIFLIIMGFIIFALRPFQECSWYELGCNAGGTLTSPIFLVIMLILVIIGVKKLI